MAKSPASARAPKADDGAATYTLVNGSTGDPMLFVDYPGRHDAFLFDAGDNGRLSERRLADLRWLFVTHHHIDHFVGLDRILRANLDGDKTVTLVGPEGTIERVHRRLTSYAHSWFPFQKLVLDVKEVVGKRLREAKLAFAEQLPTPKVVERQWSGPVVHEDDQLIVEAVPVDHTVPCLAFAIVEKPGWAPEAKKCRSGALKPGAWMQEALARLRAGAERGEELRIAGGTYRLGDLADQYFRESPGVRIAYVTDTMWSESVKPALVKLAKKARRLYCDSAYLSKDRDRAEKYKHMTASDAAELAAVAKVVELVPMHYSGRYGGDYRALVDEAKAAFERVSPEWVGE
jgi:ribonuclease Z